MLQAKNLLSALGALLFTATGVHAAPRTPADDREVLERLRSGPEDARVAKLRSLREQLAQKPDDLPTALEAARKAVDLARATSDPRWLGRAESALRPWWDAAQPPEQVLVLRATIRQSSHEFEPALVDLQRALQLAPNDAQAWLTDAAVLQVKGEFAKARKACAALWRLAPRPIAATCLAQVMSLSGELSKSRLLLQGIMAADGAADTGQEIWTRTALAEMAVRAGDGPGAESEYRAALRLDPDDPYLLGSYSDFLLDQGRAGEVVPLLQSRGRADGLLLRLALAEKATGASNTSVHVQALTDRFAASHLRGDVVHRREESRFALQLRGDSKDALRLARENFEVQREPADLRVYLEAAVAAHDRDAAKPALAFLEVTKMQDATLARLKAQLEMAR